MIFRISIGILIGFFGFCVGLFSANIAEWEKFIGAIAISLSALLATTIATLNINQSRHNELIKRTLDALNNKPMQDKELSVFRNRMNSLINKYELWNKPISSDLLAPVIGELKLGESQIARRWLVYLKNLAIGIEEGLYDQEMVEKTLCYLPLNVWRDFWPIAKYQELQLRDVNDKFHNSNYLEYQHVEEWAFRLADGSDITREKPKKQYSEIDHLLKDS